MDRLEVLKSKVIYYDNLERRKCPACNKIYLRENITEIIHCDRCKKYTKFFKQSVGEIKKRCDIIFGNIVSNCNDETMHIRACKLIRKMKLMNDKEIEE